MQMHVTKIWYSDVALKKARCGTFLYFFYPREGFHFTGTFFPAKNIISARLMRINFPATLLVYGTYYFSPGIKNLGCEKGTTFCDVLCWMEKYLLAFYVR